MNPYSNNIRLVIFDLDGVLVNRVSDKYFDGEGTNWIDRLAKKGIDVTDRKILEEISKKRFEDDKGKRTLYGWVNQLIPEMAKTKKLAILTNNSSLTVSDCLGGSEKYFSIIKTWESVPELKPSPRGIMNICRELNINAREALMVGDSMEDSVAAAKAGVNSLTVRAGEYPSRLI